MNSSKRLHIACVGVLLFASGLIVTPAFALTLDEAKSQGLVGEQLDGYLGVVADGNPEAQSLVSEINAQRQAKYREIAEKNNTSLQSVELLAAKKAVSITPSGQFIRLQDGTWRRK